MVDHVLRVAERSGALFGAGLLGGMLALTFGVDWLVTVLI